MDLLPDQQIPGAVFDIFLLDSCLNFRIYRVNGPEGRSGFGEKCHTQLYMDSACS